MRNIKIVCSFLLFFTINIMSAYATPNLYFNPSPVYTVVGNTYSVNVSVRYGVNDLYGYEFKVKWDKNILTFLPLSVTYYKPFGTYFLVGKADITYDANYGYFYLIYSARNPTLTGFSGYYNIDLVQLKFQVNQETSTLINLIETKLSNSNAQPISHTTSDVSFIPYPTGCVESGGRCGTGYPSCCPGKICRNIASMGGLTCIVPPNSGCPTLFTYDGKEYVKERKTSIHSQPGIDTVDDIALITKPVVVNGNYLLQLKETTLPEHSYIDAVKLFITDSEGKKEAELVSAKHSKYGDVTEALAKSDDVRTDTKVLDEIKLKFAVPKLKGEVKSFIFEIEGYNPASEITSLKDITGFLIANRPYKLDITSIINFFKGIFGLK